MYAVRHGWYHHIFNGSTFLSQNVPTVRIEQFKTLQLFSKLDYKSGYAVKLLVYLSFACIYAYQCQLFFILEQGPQCARASSFKMFLHHTQRRTTVGRTSPDEWFACRRDLYLTKHNTHNRHIYMPPVGFEPTISAGERSQSLIVYYTYKRYIISWKA